jgi:PST family polysaccharide transporter
MQGMIQLAAEDWAMNESLMKALPSSVAHMLTQRPGVQKIIANTGWLFVDKFVSLVAGLLVGALVARYLGPAQYGIYNYAVAFVALFAPLVEVGLRDIIIRDVLRATEDKDEILGTGFGLQLAGGLLALVLAIGIGQITRPEDSLTRWLIAILAARFAFQALSYSPDYWFQSQVQSKYTVWARNIALVLVAVLKIGLVVSGAPLIAFAWAALCEVLVFTVALLAFHRLSGEILSVWRASFPRAKRLLKNSWPLLVSAFAITVYMKIGQVMLRNMVDEQALGLYAVAARLSELWYFIPVAIASSFYPVIVRSRDNHNGAVYRKRIQLFYDIMAGISYAIVVPLVLLAPILVETLFGSDYSEAGPILRVQAWALLFVSLGVARGRWLMAEDMVRFSMLATILGALTNVALNFVLIPRYGGLGVAWATTISQAVSAYLSSLLSRRLWPVFSQLSLSLLLPFRLSSLKRSLYETR